MAEHPSLMEALLAFQADAPSLKKDATNPHYKNRYVTLDSLTAAVRKPLADHGLIWATLPNPDGLRYQLIHAKTGESIAGTMPLLLSKEDSQGYGSALSYARRYAMCAVLNLVADEDDDGAMASQRPSKPFSAPKKASPTPTPTLDAQWMEALAKGYKDAGWKPTDLRMHLTAVGVQDTSDVKQAMRSLSVEQARELQTEMFKAATGATEEAA